MKDLIIKEINEAITELNDIGIECYFDENSLIIKEDDTTRNIRKK